MREPAAAAAEARGEPLALAAQRRVQAPVADWQQALLRLADDPGPFNVNEWQQTVDVVRWLCPHMDDEDVREAFGRMQFEYWHHREGWRRMARELVHRFGGLPA